MQYHYSELTKPKLLTKSQTESISSLLKHIFLAKVVLYSHPGKIHPNFIFLGISGIFAQSLTSD